MNIEFLDDISCCTVFAYLTRSKLNPSAHGIFKLLKTDEEVSLAHMQEKLSSAKDLVITQIEINDALFYCIHEHTKKDELIKKLSTPEYYDEFCYVGELDYHAAAIEGDVNCILTVDEHLTSEIYILLKNRLRLAHEFKIGDKCVYANPTLQVGIICGISDNTKGLTIYTVKPYNARGAKKNFTLPELSAPTNFRKFFNGSNVTDIFYMDFDAIVDKGMKFCGF